ncbi:hypothetical protein ACFOY8_14275 [Thalassospira xianhensis]|uniref:Uncharacterized protein n=1 Tax=Thalassospira xianhensis MCCC 1A02616 TaxID=1177929 RepID=A0A367UI33_9PROT|nr:hypothetical protein [Thalassospira xianhensis]RCK07680.1 hypothetical protein TH5_00990 [Thalassospira xianhensis MCCC 1A02616]
MTKILYWQRRWLTGGCFDMALAMAEHFPDASFVAIGSSDFPTHVGLKGDFGFFDIRGALETESDFCSGFDSDVIYVVDRAVVELHAGCAGLKPPYRGVVEINDARETIRTYLLSAIHECQKLNISSELAFPKY